MVEFTLYLFGRSQPENDWSAPVGRDLLVSPEDINARNEEFWKNRNQEFLQRLRHPVVLTHTMKELQRYVDDNLDVRHQRPMESLAQDYNEVLSDQQRYLAGRGGRASKSDALQQIIVHLVESNSKITSREVLTALRREMYEGVIVDITDRHISFADSDGRIKDAPLSGLKDRVSRVRKASGLSLPHSRIISEDLSRQAS